MKGFAHCNGTLMTVLCVEDNVIHVQLLRAAHGSLTINPAASRVYSFARYYEKRHGYPLPSEYVKYQWPRIGEPV